MPCGMFLRRQQEDLFEKKYPKPHSAACSEWMGYLETTRGIDIQHARNGTEFRVGSRKIPVDGYCRFLFEIICFASFILISNLFSLIL